MGGHDVPRGLAGTSLFGPTAAAGISAIIGPCAMVGLRESIMPVRAHRPTVGAGESSATRVADVFGRKPVAGPPISTGELSCRQTILAGIGVAARTIKRLLACFRPARFTPSRISLRIGKCDLFDDNLIGVAVRK